MKKIECLRCGREMDFLLSDQIQLGKAGFLLRDLSHLVSGALPVEIYACPECGKLELYRAEKSTERDDGYFEGDEIPTRICPNCGDEHDFDYPKCPKCKFDYYAE